MIRFTSSGMFRSNERRPASTCAQGMRSFAQSMAHAMVEFTSPATTTRSGFSRKQTVSNPVITLAVCSACEPDPIPR